MKPITTIATLASALASAAGFPAFAQIGGDPETEQEQVLAVGVAGLEASPFPSAKADERLPVASDSDAQEKRGWSLRPRGRLQFDLASVNAPDSTGRDIALTTQLRRARLGVLGDIPGGLGYRVELDFSGGDVNLIDAFLSYRKGKVEVRAGQLNPFQGLERLTSAFNSSFIERAAWNDAFGFERRVGAAIIVKEGDALVQAGVFTDNIDALSKSDNWSVDGRAVYMPKIGDTQLHMGASMHYNELPGGSNVRYRQRPLVRVTEDRFIDTGELNADHEFGLGVEGALIAGPLHIAAEAFWQKVGLTRVAANPTYFGGMIEAGLYLTKGDTRSYKDGAFDRNKPARPLGKHGFGSLQLSVRYDRLDLNDAGLVGGTQDGYIGSVVWRPSEYIMVLANYGTFDYVDAVFRTVTGSTRYNVDVFGLRTQFDF